MALGDQDLALLFVDGSEAIVTSTGQRARVHLDFPEQVDELHQLSKPGVVVGKPKITFATAALTGLVNGVAITVDGVPYRICHAWKIDDGLISCAELNAWSNAPAPRPATPVAYGRIDPVEALDGVRTAFTFHGLPPTSTAYVLFWNGQAQSGFTQVGEAITTEFVPKADDELFVYH